MELLLPLLLSHRECVMNSRMRVKCQRHAKERKMAIRNMLLLIPPLWLPHTDYSGFLSRARPIESCAIAVYSNKQELYCGQKRCFRGAIGPRNATALPHRVGSKSKCTGNAATDCLLLPNSKAPCLDRKRTLILARLGIPAYCTKRNCKELW